MRTPRPEGAAAAAVLWLLAACACAAPEPPPAERTSPTEAARQRELSFWRLYREATRQRIAGAPDMALAHYDSALALKPRHGDALYHSGNAAFELARFDTAEARWRRLLAVDASNARAHVQLGVLYSCGRSGAPQDLDRARAELQRALALNRAETGPQERLAEIALLQGDEEAALRHAEAVRRTNERSVAAHYLVGYLHWRAGRAHEARYALESAVHAASGGEAEVSASGEGQTRKGDYRPLLAAAEGGLLAVSRQRLSAWPAQEIAAADVDREYESFARRLSRRRGEMGLGEPQRPTTEEEG